MLFHGVWYPAGLVPRGIRPRRTSVCYKMYTTLPLFCGVWYPARLSFAGIRPRRIRVCYTMYTTLPFSVGSDTPQGLVLRGLIPRWILFCGVSDPAGKLRPCRTGRKRFESLPFSLNGHFLKIGCKYKLHDPRHIGLMLKEHSIWKIFLCSAGSDTPQNNF